MPKLKSVLNFIDHICKKILEVFGYKISDNEIHSKTCIWEFLLESVY